MDGGQANLSSARRLQWSPARSVLLLILGLGFPLAMEPAAHGQSMLDRAVKALLSASPQEQVGSHLKGAPLPSGPQTPTDKDFQKAYAAWWERSFVSHLPAQLDPATAAYVQAVLAVLDGQGPLSDRIIAQSRSFDLDSVKDPGLLFLIGCVDPASDRGLAAMKKSLDGMPGSPYPKFFWYLASVNYGKSLKATNTGTPDQLKAADQQSLAYLKQGLADGSFLPDEMSSLRIRLLAPSGRDLLSRNAVAVGQILESSTSVAPWLTQYIEGRQAVEDAWTARGSGWANTVTDQGWKDFAADIATARAHLTKSWQLNPHDPAAAAEMITVSMAENEQIDTMRTWFDRSVAADFDDTEAYNNLAWGLRPRWLGNFAEMTAFGRECAATARFDTSVPYVFVTSEMHIAEDSSNPASVFDDQALDADILAVLDKYFAEPNPPIPVQYARTIAAIMAHKLGRMDEVRQHLAAIHFQPVDNELYRQLDNLPALVEQAQQSPNP